MTPPAHRDNDRPHPSDRHDDPVVDYTRLDAAARRELLSSYLDDELSAEDALRVTRWLDTDPDALRDAEHLRRMWDVLEHYVDEPVPADFAERVFASVGIERADVAGGGQVFQLRWYQRPQAVAAAMLLAIGALIFAFTKDAPVAPPTGTETAEVTPKERAAIAEVLDVFDDAEIEEGVAGVLDLVVQLDDDEFEQLIALGPNSDVEGS